MKKKFLMVLVALTLATTSLVGCSFEFDLGSLTKDDKSVVDELKEVEDDKDNKKDKSDKKDKDKDKDKKDEEKDDVEKEPEKEVVWSQAYNDYFRNHDFKNGVKLTATEFDEAENATVEITLASTQEERMTRSVIKFENGNEMLYEMYYVDGLLYSYMEYKDTNLWYSATPNNQEEIDLYVPADTLGLEDFDETVFADFTYGEEREIDGVIYDILCAVNDGGTVTYIYINRETQAFEKMGGDVDGEELMFDVEFIDKIELPKDPATAEQISVSDIETNLGMLFMLAYSDVESVVNDPTATPTHSNDNKPTSFVNVGEMEFDEVLVVDGNRLVLGETTPTEIADMFGITYENADNLDEIIDPDYYDGVFFYYGDNEEYTAWVKFANFTNNPMKLGECALYGFELEAEGYTQGEAFGGDVSFEIGNVINEDTTQEELLSMLGEPSYEYESEDYGYHDYDFDLPLGVDYFDQLYSLEVGYNAGGMYLIEYEFN